MVDPEGLVPNCLQAARPTFTTWRPAASTQQAVMWSICSTHPVHVGHGSQQRDPLGEERDGMNDTL